MSINEKTIIARKPLVPILEAIDRKGVHKVFRNISDCVTIGRSKQADISIDDDKLSRYHFMIVKTNGKYEIKDLNSTNGVVVNGSKVFRTTLIGNDKIVVGNTTFNFLLTRDNINLNNIIINKCMLDNKGFNKNYSEKKKEFKTKVFFQSLLISFLVFSVIWTIVGREKQAEVAPIVKEKKEISTVLRMEDELNSAILLEADKSKARNYFRLAEYHFKYGSYSLAKKAMNSYFALVPNSVIAPSFIAACEEVSDKRTLADSKLSELEKETQKRELIENLIRQGQSELDLNNYSSAISIFNKVLALDEYNTEAYSGLLEAEKYLLKDTKIPNPNEPVYVSDMGTTLVNNMNKAYRNGDFTKAYEVSQRIIKIGQSKAGRQNFLQAFNMAKNISDRMNEKYKDKIEQAKLLAKVDSDKEALNIYKEILKDFPYHNKANEGSKEVLKSLNKKAQELYARSLISKSQNNTEEEKENLNLIVQNIPVSDPYYAKAKNRLSTI